MSTRRQRLRLALGQSSPWENIAAGQSTVAAGGSTGSIEWWNPLTWPAAIAGAASIPGSSLQSLVANAATGNLTQAQVTALTQQQSAAYQQAGMPASQAAQQAQQDVTSALATFSAPGAFGVNWQGALPTSTNWFDQIVANPVSDAGGWLASNWWWMALGAVGVWYVSKRL